MSNAGGGGGGAPSMAGPSSTGGYCAWAFGRLGAARPPDGAGDVGTAPVHTQPGCSDGGLGDRVHAAGLCDTGGLPHAAATCTTADRHASSRLSPARRQSHRSIAVVDRQQPTGSGRPRRSATRLLARRYLWRWRHVPRFWWQCAAALGYLAVVALLVAVQPARPHLRTEELFGGERVRNASAPPPPYPVDFSLRLRALIAPTNATCAGVDAFVVVKSRPSEYFQRKAIRRTWGAAYEGRLVFIMGVEQWQSPPSSAIRLEAAVHGDLLVYDFVDTYRNLSLKSLGALRWAADACDKHSVDYLLQVDSDALLLPAHIERFVSERRGRRRRVYGRCWRNAKVLRPGDATGTYLDKWSVPPSRYIARVYPHYCAGVFLLMSRDTVDLLLAQVDAAPHRPYFSIDDAFFTGILAESAMIQRINLKYRLLWKEDLKPAAGGGNNSSAPVAANLRRRGRKPVIDTTADTAGPLYNSAAAAADVDDAVVEKAAGGANPIVQQLGTGETAGRLCTCIQPLAIAEFKSPALLVNAWMEYREFFAQCDID